VARLALERLGGRELADRARLLGVDLGGEAREGALEVAERVRADPQLLAQALLHLVREHVAERTRAGELHVAVAVRLLRVDERAAVGAVDAFGERDEAAAARLVDAVDVGGEAVEVEDALGDVDEVRPVVVVLAREHAGGGQPAGVPAHDHVDLDAREAAVVLVVPHHGLRDEPRGGAVAGAVVGLAQVVVDRLRDVEQVDVVGFRRRDLVEDVRGLGRVVASDVEEVADVVLAQPGEDLDALLARRLLAHGAQGGARRPRDGFERRALLAPQVDELVLEDPLDAVHGAVDLADLRIVDERLDETDQALVDDGGRAAGLADQDVADGLGHGGKGARP
jgi:hypothetical protein